MEIREPHQDELREMRLLSAMSFNVPMSWVEQGPPARPEGALCAYEDGRMLAMARDIPMREWFGGRAMRCAGISGVATVPEVRGTGVGDTLMRTLLEEARERGAVITTLFPATVPFY